MAANRKDATPAKQRGQLTLFGDKEVPLSQEGRINRFRAAANGECYFEPWAEDARTVLDALDAAEHAIKIMHWSPEPRDYEALKLKLWQAEKQVKVLTEKARTTTVLKWALVDMFALGVLVAAILVLLRTLGVA